ncbi:MAG TPA: hypothetical protein K8V15_03020, partial [Tessaracoccus flavescens]|nr:hypothetical protein [Tessaracoccus flavescens]
NHDVGPAPIAARLGAPDELDQVLAAALSPDPNRRPQTAGLLAEAFDRLADQLPGGDQYQPRPMPTTVIAPAPPTPVTAATPTSAASAPSLPRPSASSLPPRSETPVSMLDNYIGPGRYQLAKDQEKHSPWFYVWVTGSAILLLGLTIWMTIYVLTG